MNSTVESTVVKEKEVNIDENKIIAEEVTTKVEEKVEETEITLSLPESEKVVIGLAKEDEIPPSVIGILYNIYYIIYDLSYIFMINNNYLNY